MRTSGPSCLTSSDARPCTRSTIPSLTPKRGGPLGHASARPSRLDMAPKLRMQQHRQAIGGRHRGAGSTAVRGLDDGWTTVRCSGEAAGRRYVPAYCSGPSSWGSRRRSIVPSWQGACQRPAGLPAGRASVRRQPDLLRGLDLCSERSRVSHALHSRHGAGK